MSLHTLNWQPPWTSLSERFYTKVPATPLPNPYWVAYSPAVAEMLGIDPANFKTDANLALLSGAKAWPHSIATVYAGHQFGVWAGQLGDGRALLLGQVTHQGASWELQLKGAGKTPYSRMGDGRAVLRSSIREFLCSEAMAGLGIPTTRALTVIGAPYPVQRETTESAAVVTRVAPSFIRFGHFEHFAARQDNADLQILADFTIRSQFPEILNLPPAERYSAWLGSVVKRTAELLAAWQSVGFCHGVMNTDNMSILGLTIDYGPFGFLDQFDWRHICNHSDTQGRYAYQAQPQIAYWNLYALGQTLLPLFSTHPTQPTDAEQQHVQDILDTYPSHFQQAMQRRWQDKFGLDSRHIDDADWFADSLQSLQDNQVDFTLFFRRLSDFSNISDAFDGPSNNQLRDLFLDRSAADRWLASYRQRLQLNHRSDAERQQIMRQTNPKFILRNYLAEQAIQQAQAGQFQEIATLLTILQHPCDEWNEHPEYQRYAQLPPDWASSLSVSCSS